MKPKRRDIQAGSAIVITGISGNLGRLLTKRLHTRHAIIGIDKRPFEGKPKDVTHYRIDVRRRKAEDLFRSQDIGALVHLGLVHRPSPLSGGHRGQNVVGTMKLLEYCARYKVPKVVLLSSGYAYGAQPENSNFLGEDAPLAADLNTPEMRALIEWDMYAQSFFWKHPRIETVILRPVHVVGPTVRNAPSNYLRLKHPPTLLGFDPMIQLLHEDDLMQAISLALAPGRRGVFNVVGPGELPLSRVLSELGRRPVPIPHFLAEPLLRQAWRLGLAGFYPGDLPHLRFQCMLDGSRARQELGFRPAKTLRETIRSVG
jgi:UDP-glucose 4-epimerase